MICPSLLESRITAEDILILENSSYASSSNQSKNPHLSLLASYLTAGFLHYTYSTKTRKQISSPTQPYKIYQTFISHALSHYQTS